MAVHPCIKETQKILQYALVCLFLIDELLNIVPQTTCQILLGIFYQSDKSVGREGHKTSGMFVLEYNTRQSFYKLHPTQ